MTGTEKKIGMREMSKAVEQQNGFLLIAPLRRLQALLSTYTVFDIWAKHQLNVQRPRTVYAFRRGVMVITLDLQFHC